MPEWLSGWGLLAGGALAGVAALCWRQLSGFLSWLAGFAVIRIQLRAELGQAAVHFFSARRHHRSWLRAFFLASRYVRPEKRVRRVLFEDFQAAARLCWVGWRPLLVKAEENRSAVWLTFLRGTLRADELVREISRRANELFQRAELGQSRFWVTVVQGRMLYQKVVVQGGGSGEKSQPLSWLNGSSSPATPPPALEGTDANLLRSHIPLEYGYDDLEMPAEPKKLETMALDGDAEDAVAEVRRWKDSKDWYLERGIPWRHGLLLIGKPGTGKSSFARALGLALDLPIVCFDLATLTNPELTQEWANHQTNNPCIYLIEDIDAVFDGRENVTGADGGVTFDCLLNCVSGVRNSDGVLLVVTTNRPERIDPALADVEALDGHPSRPGRIDRVVRMPAALSTDGRRKIAERIMSGCSPSEVVAVVVEGEGDSGAQFQYRCQKLALERYWGRGVFLPHQEESEDKVLRVRLRHAGELRPVPMSDGD